MDYDDNDFQSQNLHIAGEGSNKFPPILRPYALPKFEFDDTLHGPLRFDSLVETEVFLGIESNEDSQWIEEFSRGSSGIQFNTSAAETCSISRRNNVWSEATSSESVEMLLKSVGQEELIHVQTSTKELDACDELGCIIKQMDPNLKQDSNTPTRVVDVTNVQPTSLPSEYTENFSELDKDGSGQQPTGDELNIYKSDAYVAQASGDLTDISVDVRLPITEGDPFVDDECNDVNQKEFGSVNKSLDNRTQYVSSSGLQVDSTIVAVQSTITANEGLRNEGSLSNLNETAYGNMDASGIDKVDHKEKESVLSQEVQMSETGLNVETDKASASRLDNSSSVTEANFVDQTCTIDTKLSSMEESYIVSKGDSDRSGMRPDNASVAVIEGNNTAVEKHELGESNTSSLGSDNLVNKCGPSLLSTEDNMASADKVEGNSTDFGAANSSLPEVCSSAEIISETHPKCHVSSSTIVESSETCEKDVVPLQSDVQKSNRDDPVIDQKKNIELPSDGKGVGASFSVIQENELITSKSHSESTAGSESVGCAPVSSETCVAADAVLDHKAVEVASLPCLLNCSGKKEEMAPKIFTKASSSIHETSCQATAEDPVSGYEMASAAAATQMPSVSVDHSLLAADASDTRVQVESQEAVIEKVNQDGAKDKETSQPLSDSTTNKGESIEALMRENVELEPTNIPEVNNGKLGNESSALEESHQDTRCKSQEDIAGVAPEDKNIENIAVPSTKVVNDTNAGLDKPAGISHVVNTTTVNETRAELDKAAGDLPIVIKSSEEGIKRLLHHTVSVSEVNDDNVIKVQSSSKESNQDRASKDDNSFTFEVTPVADLPQKDAKKWQPFAIMGASQASPTVDGSTSSSGLGQSDPNVSQGLPHGSPKVSQVTGGRAGSKGTSERKARRSSGKTTKETGKKRATPVKETASARLERGDNKVVSVSPSPPGISQLVQSSDVQRYGHVDSSSVKPFVLATSTSGLPDLNSSVSPAAVFQQPFTDLQQVQLRAQIFVYGALIQGTPPDEAYMISAFGGHDGGRGTWENAWRLCIDRLHGQKSPLITPETPLPSRSGTRAPDQSVKQSVVQTKVVSSPAGRGSSKGTPTIVNPIVPFSSPLWSMPTPGDTMQSSMPRGPVMDYQRALSPLHPHQTSAIRSFVGHSPSWLSQAPFGGPWVASPQPPALETSGRFSVHLPITEPIQLTPVKESTLPHSSLVKPIGSVAQSGASPTVFPGTSVLDVKMVTASSGQTSGDPKPRKIKKTSVSETPRQNILPLQPQMDSVIASVVTGSANTSITVATPASFVSKVPGEKFISPIAPTSLVDVRKGVQNSETRGILPEETLGKLKEARTQAEDAANLAASAVSHSEEIWNQLDKQRNSGLSPDDETKLASAAVAIAAAAAVAKAAAAAAKVASNAAMQAKLMAEEVVSIGTGGGGQANVISFADGMKSLGKTSPALILKGDDGTNNSTSILVAAREAARKRVEAASAASKQAENVDAIVKAAELAAEAVSQAGKIVAMGDPLTLSELVASGPGGYWKVPQVSSELVLRSNQIGKENVIADSGQGQDASARQLKEVLSDKQEKQISNIGKSPTSTDIIGEDHGSLVDVLSGSGATPAKDARGPKSRKSGLAKTIGVVPESENGSRSNVQNEHGKEETLEENSIKEGSCVEVFKDGNGFKAAWFLADVLSLKEGKAYVRYSEISSSEGSEKLEEWLMLEGGGDEAPKIRIARPNTAIPLEGKRKRRRALVGDYNWSVGDRVDTCRNGSWWEGVVTEKNKKDEAISVHFPAQGETLALRSWDLRPSLIWKDGEWIEYSSSGENKKSSHGGDTPQEKRQRVRSPAVEAKGKDKALKSGEAMESEDPTLMDLSVDGKLFNIGKSTKDDNRPNVLRMTRTGLQKEGSRVIFGVPKPGKKRKFMEVSKHYVAGGSSQMNEANDSVKFAKYLMPQGGGTRAWRSTAKTESIDRRAALSKPKVLKSGKPQNVSSRTIPQKDKLSSSAVSAPGDSANADHATKFKDSVEGASDKSNLLGFKSFSSSDGAAEGPILFSALALPSDTVTSKKSSSANAKAEHVSKGKLAPGGGKLGKIEENKTLNGNSAKSTSDSVEPRRSNRRIQPTSRLLEGLQSSLMVSKIPSVTHDKTQKSRKRE